MELALVPGGLIYEMSSWTRAIVMPLTIIQAKTDTRPVPAGFTLDELIVPEELQAAEARRLSALFRQLDIALKMWATRGPEMIRQPAIREAEKWILDRTRHSDGLGAIYPSMMYLIMALDALGYPRDHPDLIEAIRQFEGLLTETPEAFNVDMSMCGGLGFVVYDRIILTYKAPDGVADALSNGAELIKSETLATSLSAGSPENGAHNATIKVGDATLQIGLTKA